MIKDMNGNKITPLKAARIAVFNYGASTESTGYEEHYPDIDFSKMTDREGEEYLRHRKETIARVRKFLKVD